MNKFYITFQFQCKLLRHRFAIIYADTVQEARHMLWQSKLNKFHSFFYTEEEWEADNGEQYCSEGLLKEIKAFPQEAPALE